MGSGSIRVWRGNINDIQINHDEFGRYRLDRPGRGRFGSDRIDLAEICINHSERAAGVCIGADWDLSSQLGQVNVNAEQLQLELIQAFLPDIVELEGGSQCVSCSPIAAGSSRHRRLGNALRFSCPSTSARY